MTALADALRLAGLGWDVFPVNPDDKRPYPGSHGHLEASADKARAERQWTRHPDALVGVRPPVGTVFIDLDTYKRADVEAAMASKGWTLPDPSFAQKTRSGGEHVPYATDGRYVANTTDWGGMEAFDTRTHNGYVVAWQPAEWRKVSTLTPAPEWLYDEPGRPTGTREGGRGGTDAYDDSMADAIGQRMTSNNHITRWLGMLSAADPGRDYDWFLAALRAARAEGRIVALTTPWTDHDLRTLARTGARFAEADLIERDAWWAEEGITYENVDEVQARWDAFAKAHRDKALTNVPKPNVRAKRKPMSAAELGTKTFPPLHWYVPAVIPEGMTLFSAAPKSGKSLFCYQLGAELPVGGSILGRDVPVTPVLYYALEDGERRSQGRIRDALAGRPFPVALDLYWESPRLGDGLEEEVGEWLDEHTRGLVIIDVLAKVRPTGNTARGMNAYDADYEALSNLHATAKRRPGSGIIVVTHDRKAGSEDWLSKVTGTRGVTGVADTALYISRTRGEKTGTFHVTGRDVEDENIKAAFTGHGWQKASVLLTLTDTRRTIYEYVERHGIVTPQQVIDGTGLVPTVVWNRMRDMVNDGQLVQPSHGLYGIPVEEPVEEAV